MRVPINKVLMPVMGYKRKFGPKTRKRRRTPLSSKHQVNGGFNLTRPLPGFPLDWLVQVDASYEGKKFIQVQNRAIIPSSVLLNASIGLQHEHFCVASGAGT
jgi:hypothetical protein